MLVHPNGLMCGIFGCIADDASSRVLEGLRKLEYRGYDSAGLAAIFSELEDPIETERTTGYVSDLVLKANGRLTALRFPSGTQDGQLMVELLIITRILTVAKMERSL